MTFYAFNRCRNVRRIRAVSLVVVIACMGATATPTSRTPASGDSGTTRVDRPRPNASIPARGTSRAAPSFARIPCAVATTVCVMAASPQPTRSTISCRTEAISRAFGIKRTGNRWRAGIIRKRRPESTEGLEIRSADASRCNSATWGGWGKSFVVIAPKTASPSTRARRHVFNFCPIGAVAISMGAR